MVEITEGQRGSRQPEGPLLGERAMPIGMDTLVGGAIITIVLSVLQAETAQNFMALNLF